jgi:hypothetical protein
LVSGSSQVTYSGLTGVPTGIVSSSTQITGYNIFATTGSNTFQANQTITGSLFITQNLVVAGSSSIQYISSSVLDIADNTITVNTFNPSVRFGGLGVIDSGSSPQVSGSILFDSVKDQWIFVHQNQSVVTSSVLLMGPETYNDLGNESYISANRLPKGSGVEHLRDSNITDTGTVVSINSNTAVTGSFTVVSGSAVELQVTNTGVNIGSISTDNHNVTGSLRVSGSMAVNGAGTFLSSVTANRGSFNPSFIAIGNSNGNGQIQLSNSANYIIGAGTDFGGMSFTVGGTEKLYILNNGNVGIGTGAAAGAPLEVRGGSGANLRVRNNGTNNLLLQNYNDTDNYRNLQIAASTIQLFTGDDGGTSSTERMRITSGGTLLIGGTSDVAGGLLQVLSSSNTAISIRSTTAGGTQPRLRFFHDDNDEFVISGGNGLRFLGSGVNERMRITSGGNVGIGTTDPSTRLDVLGTIRSGTNTLVTDGLIGRFSFGSPTYSDTPFAEISSNFEGANWFRGANLIFKTSQSGDITANNSVERMRITAGGTVYINTTTNPSTDNAVPQFGIIAGAGTDAVNIRHTQDANNTINIWQTGTTSHNAIAFYKGNTQTNRGLITVTTSGTTYNSVSDYRLKENITPLENGLDRVLQLKPSKFNWIETGNETEGFIAHELQEYFPDAVTGEKDAVYSSTGNIKPQSVDYGRITPLLVKAIQEQQAQIESLKAEIQTLKQ